MKIKKWFLAAVVSLAFVPGAKAQLLTLTLTSGSSTETFVDTSGTGNIEVPNSTLAGWSVGGIAVLNFESSSAELMYTLNSAQDTGVTAPLTITLAATDVPALSSSNVNLVYGTANFSTNVGLVQTTSVNSAVVGTGSAPGFGDLHTTTPVTDSDLTSPFSYTMQVVLTPDASSVSPLVAAESTLSVAAPTTTPEPSSIGLGLCAVFAWVVLRRRSAREI